MPFFAGAVYGEAVMDDSKWKSGMSGMTGSMLKGQIAFALLQKGVKIVTDTMKQAIEAFKIQEKVETQLNAVLKSTQHAAGLTAKEIKAMASSLQNVTTFGDEVILSGQNLLLTFTKIGKDIFPQATETMLDMSAALGQDLKSSAIQLGKALQDPILGVTALRRVGVNFNKEQQDVIKNLVETGRQAEAQAMILKELQAEFGGSAKAMRDTFGGAMQSLKNVQGDVMEDIGRFISVIGKDFVNELVKGTTAIKDFINSSEGIEIIANVTAYLASGFQLLGTILKEAFTKNMEAAKKIINTVAERLKEFNKEGKSNVSIFTLLSAALKLSNIGFGIMIKLIVVSINNFFNLFKAIKATIDIFKLYYEVATGKKKWKDLKDQLEESGNAWKDFGTGVIDGVKDIISSTIDEFKQLPMEIKKEEIKLKTNWDKTFKEMKDKAKAGIGGIKEEITTMIPPPPTTIFDQWKKKFDEFKEKAKGISIAMKEQFDKIKGVFDNIAGAVGTVFSGIQDTVKMFMENDMIALQNHHGRRLEEIENQSKAETEIIDSKYSNDIASLQALRDSNVITEEEYKIRRETLDSTYNANKEASEKSLNAALAKENEDFRKKEYAQKKKAFEVDKGFRIAQVWIGFASGLMAAWASAMAIPFPGNVIVGGIMSGILTGMAIAQTVAISQQQFPAYAVGGTVGKNRNVRMNESGGEIATLPDGTQIVPNDISRQIAASTGKMRENNISISFAGANISDNMSLEKITDTVIRKLGQKLRLS